MHGTVPFPLSSRDEARLRRQRLMSPPNAKKDDGIDLRRPPQGMREYQGSIMPRRAKPEQPIIEIELPKPQQPVTTDELFNRLPVRRVIIAVSEYFHMPIARIIGEQRNAQLVRIRHIGMYLCRELTGCSLPVIGRAFGGRDHTTAMWACRQMEKKRITDRVLNAQLVELKARLEQSA